METKYNYGKSIRHKHLNKFKCIVVFLSVLLSTSAAAEDQLLVKLFMQQGIDGTIVISSLKTGRTFIHNNLRANQRFSTASTFKIMNTLIALEENVMSVKNDVFKWGGHVYDYSDWNHDQTLESVFQVSCVWCYQELAHRIGKEKYIKYLSRLEYGELSIPFEETTFWLDSSLQISAAEQVNFLEKVQQRTFPFRVSTYETLREIMLVEQAPNFSIWAKTGLATRTSPQIGWYVGYVETKNDIWYFSTNIQVRDKDDLRLRQTLTLDALAEKGIL